MYIAPRTCVLQPDKNAPRVSDDNPVIALEALREVYAFVLLGDPGAGKSQAFASEAGASGMKVISARDFITFEQTPEEWCNQTIFIDGLDETRAGSHDGRASLDAIRSRLDRLGKPRFRLSCRAADWLGQSDSTGLRSVVPAGQEFKVCHLEPLNEQNIEEILHRNHGINDAKAFVQNANENRLSELLSNPQTLKMLAKAVGPENNWPSSRLAIYELACAKLIQEPNQEHQVAAHKTRPTDASLINAAGYLMCLYLISDLPALSVLQSEETSKVHVRDLENPGNLPVFEALQTRLFQSQGNDRFVPAHRTVAEFLAARFLTQRLEAGLPLGRVLALMCGADGGVVTGMRGLHAWLAACSGKSRGRLIERDPLGVLLYGDARNFSPEEKKWILQAFHRVPDILENMRWQDRTSNPFSALATPEMATALEKILRQGSRARTDQLLVSSVVDALCNGPAIANFGALLLDVARDESWWSGTRRYALLAYLKKYADGPAIALELLEEIQGGKIGDDEDELLGTLLMHLYPAFIGPSDVVRHLHAAKAESLIGGYAMFWRTRLIDLTGDDQLPELLDAFATIDKSLRNHRLREYSKPASALLARGLENLGDNTPDDKLFTWLGICLVDREQSKMEKADQGRVQAWFASRPKRFKSIWAFALKQNFENPSRYIWSVTSRFHGAPQPPGMGAWWLHQAAQENNDERAREYLDRAFSFVQMDASNKTALAGISLEDLEALASRRPGLQDSIAIWLKSDLSQNEWRRSDAQRAREDERDKTARAEHFRRLQQDLRENIAPPSALEALAAAYLDHDFQVSGETALDRLGDLLNKDADLIATVLFALSNTLLRDDLPSTEEIIQSYSAGKRFRLSLPVLVGMDLLYKSEPASLGGLSNDLLTQALVSQYAYGSNNESEWFDHLIVIRPDLVAQACVLYVQGCLKARRQHVHGTYELANNDAYASVAKIAVPLLLKQFPHRANLGQLPVLEDLLKAGLRYLPEPALGALILEKLALKSLDSPQRAYWLAAGLTLQPHKYEALIRADIFASTTLAGHLGSFFHNRHERSNKWREGRRFPESTLALLIELLGPASTPERPEGAHVVTASMHTAELIRNFAGELAATATPEAAAALSALEKSPALVNWSSNFRHARLAQQVVLRDTGFRHPSSYLVSQTLYAGKPANPADIAAIVNEALNTLAQEIRGSDLNIVRQFWNVDTHDRPDTPRPEGSCRDSLALLLRERLSRYSIQCAAEARHGDEKRSDVWCTHGAWGIPIEIKKDSNAALWTAMDTQLIAQYATDPRAGGCGIYLALWFGGGKPMKSPNTGRKPLSAEELKMQLDEQVERSGQGYISVIVLDCARRT